MTSLFTWQHSRKANENENKKLHVVYTHVYQCFHGKMSLKNVHCLAQTTTTLPKRLGNRDMRKRVVIAFSCHGRTALEGLSNMHIF